MRSRNSQSGFGLIEIAVVLTILAILYTQAVPAFSAWIGNVQVRTAAESIQNGLQLARVEAIRRNRSVIFWLTALGAAGPDWLIGCAAPVGTGSLPENPGDCPGPQGTVTVPAIATAPPINWIQRQSAAAQQTAQVQVSTPNDASVVTFNSLGMVTTNADGSASAGEIDVTNPALSTALARPLKVMVAGGSIRMCDPALSLASDPRGCN